MLKWAINISGCLHNLVQVCQVLIFGSSEAGAEGGRVEADQR